MKSGFRQSMAWLHTWTGLLVSWLLYFIFVTGTLSYFDTEIDQWMKPEAQAYSGDTAKSIAAAQHYLTEHVQHSAYWVIDLPVDRNTPFLRLYIEETPKPGEKYGRSANVLLDVSTGKPITHRDTTGSGVLYRMHYKLHYMPQVLAYWIVGVSTMFMLLAIITGIVVHKKIFKDFFTLRFNKGMTSWLDMHNLLSVMSIPFHLMISYSGLVFFAIAFMPLIVGGTYGVGNYSQRTFFQQYYVSFPEPEPAGQHAQLMPLATLHQLGEQRFGKGSINRMDVANPQDKNAQVILMPRTESPIKNGQELIIDGVTGEVVHYQHNYQGAKQLRSVLTALHEGLFADLTLRWLYFLSGVLGSAMIATGLVLWVSKRRKKQAGNLSFRLTDNLNVACIVGLPSAIAAFFLANRLLPLDMLNRAEWEIHLLFICWALTAIHSVWRNSPAAWHEQLAFGGALYTLVPMMNALTTQRGLNHALIQGDWVFAGFDLTCLAFGASMLIAARYMYLRQANEPSTSIGQ